MMSVAPVRSSLRFVGDHPLISIFLALEVSLLSGGYLLGRYSAEAARGTTGLRDVAGLMGGLAVVLAVLAAAFVVAIGIARTLRRFR